jgi:hypothetical protein
MPSKLLALDSYDQHVSSRALQWVGIAVRACSAVRARGLATLLASAFFACWGLSVNVRGGLGCLCQVMQILVKFHLVDSHKTTVLDVMCFQPVQCSFVTGFHSKDGDWQGVLLWLSHSAAAAGLISLLMSSRL